MSVNEQLEPNSHNKDKILCFGGIVICSIKYGSYRAFVNKT